MSQRLPGRPCLLDHLLDLLISPGWCPEPPKPCSALSKTPVDVSLSSSQTWLNICFCSEILRYFFFLNPKTSREIGPFFLPSICMSFSVSPFPSPLCEPVVSSRNFPKTLANLQHSSSFLPPVFTSSVILNSVEVRTVSTGCLRGINTVCASAVPTLKTPCTSL